MSDVVHTWECTQCHTPIRPNFSRLDTSTVETEDVAKIYGYCKTCKATVYLQPRV